MNINNISNSSCTGCMACTAICPLHCIKATFDKEDFLQPKADESNCINCDLCYKRCPSVNRINKNKPLSTYAFQAKDKEILHSSSSGGAAALISHTIILNGGVVYGCIMDDNLQVRHVRVENIEDCKKFTGSKYVQSDFSAVYGAIRQDCESGRSVCIIGTPCQIAGVQAFLSKDYDNLILVDLICHGVPNQWLFNEYLKWKAKQMNGDRIIAYTFRDKTKYDWGTTYKATTATATATATATVDPFYQAFLYAEIYRESCYQCIYASPDRVGDITIGDYWGIQKEHPEWERKAKEGVSVVLVNTKRGQELFNRISGKAYITESELEKVSAENQNLHAPAKRPEIRSVYYQSVKSNGFSWANKKMYTGKRYWINFAKRTVPKPVKNIIKKIIGRE